MHADRKGSISMEDIRKKYGSIKVSTKVMNRELNKVDMKLMEVERACHLDHLMDETYKLLRKDLSEQKSNFLARQSRTNLDERVFRNYIKPAFPTSAGWMSIM